MQRASVSVIVSFYNSEKYVEKCLLSIINQDLRNIEIIVVDDGSTDHTGILVREFAQKDYRIRYIATENRGLASSRKIGMQYASGEYITFVDGDDSVHTDMYWYMYEEAKAKDLDIVQCNIIPVGDYDEWKIKEQQKEFPHEVLTGEQLLELYLKRDIMPALWQRLFRNGLWKADEFKIASKVMSDHFNFPEWAIRANRCVIMNNGFYYWLTRKGSLGQPDDHYHGISAKNRFLSGISILSFSMIDYVNEESVYTYLMSYLTQTAYHLRQSNMDRINVLFEIWDALIEHYPLYDNAMKLLEGKKGINFFIYLKNDRQHFVDYVLNDFLVDMADFIGRTHYNGDSIFD